jgi:hypothetical protein
MHAGIRVVRQDPWECLVSFICSSNNNVKRIGGMIDKLKRRYGEYRCTVRRCSVDGDDECLSKEWEVLCSRDDVALAGDTYVIHAVGRLTVLINTR